MAREDRSGTRPGDRAVYIISVAAELSGVHPQTLRIYERKGLLSPARTSGNTRRYSERDIERLRAIQRLTQEEGLNLAGARMVMDLREQLQRTRQQLERTRREAGALRRSRSRGGALVLRREVEDLLGGSRWT
jgi:MerR family transcriptional regulator/heat shock protein HspR